MTAAEILVKAFVVAVKALSLGLEVLTSKPDLDLAATEAALRACEDDLAGYDDAWALLRDL